MAAEYIGHLREFDAANSDWSIFKKRIDNYFVANAITDDKRKGAILLNILNEEAYKLIYNLCLPDEPESKTYTGLSKLLSDHYKPSDSVFAARYKFYTSKKATTESAKEWSARLRNLAAACQFENIELKMVLRDIFVVAYEKGAVQDRLLEEKKTVTFDEVVELAAAKSAAQPYVSDNLENFIKKEPELHYANVNSQGKVKSQWHGSAGKSSMSCTGQQAATFSSQISKCSVCGRRNHRADKCLYRNCFCYTCKEKGHLSPMCFNKHADKTGNVRNTQNYLESAEEKYSLFTLLDRKINPMLIAIIIDGISYTFNLDTGSSFSVVSEVFYKNNFSGFSLKNTNKIFHLYNGDQIVPIGYFNCEIYFQNKSNFLDIFVIKDATGPPLLGRDFFNTFDLNICNNNYVGTPDDLNLLLKKYSDVFEPGLGTFTKGTMSIILKSEKVSPKFFRARPLPFAIKEKVEKELDRLQNLGVIEAIDYSEWATPIVPVIKKNGSVRLCGDFKITLNPYIEIDQYPLPRIEELFVKLQGGEHFTKLDLANAYTQVCLDEKSKHLVTISTHKGLFRYTRAPFGVACIPAKFQKMMESLLHGLPGVVIFLDDILVTGSNREEHLQRLGQVLRKLQNAGLKISLDKCEFFKSQISYLGFRIDKVGLHTCEDKILAIRNAPVPRDITQLKSFLGLVNYYGKFVPNLSSHLHPLYNLLRDKVEWCWSEECNKSFKKMKELLMSAEVLVHYNPELPVRFITDASKYGLGAVITHILPDGVEKPIAYASRTLSSAETKYSQIEKEGLGIIFGLCKFNQYLYGRNFVLVTDHKPLTYIFHPEKGIPQFSANRLRRWAVILSNYQYTIEFVPSAENVADSLSRLPQLQQNSTWENVDVNFINYFQNNDHFPIDFNMVQKETYIDKILQRVSRYISTGWPVKIEENLKFFYRIRNELSIEQDCLLWNNRLIIPDSLRKTILNDLHLSHMGVVKMKSLARSYFWWPGLDKDIEKLCMSCENCLIHKNNPNKAVLSSWPWPEEVWSRIHLDFMGPFLNKYFLIMVDAHSKWIEVFPMNSITSKVTIEVLRISFARFGLPRQIVTDNATTFTSDEFQTFLLRNNIKHCTSPPYQPSSNGLAENAVKSIKNSLKNALGSSKSLDLNRSLNNFLFDFRNTIHSTTGKSPASIMFGRKLRTRFDILLPESKCSDTDLKKYVANKQLKQKKYHGGKRFVTFARNSMVTVKDYRNVSKPCWIKANIYKRIGKATYLVKVPELDNVIWKRHLNQIKAICYSSLAVPSSRSTSGIVAKYSGDVSEEISVTDNVVSLSSENREQLNVVNKDSEGQSNENSNSRPRREIRPVERLNYDKL